jgi:hypothetical protein
MREIIASVLDAFDALHVFLVIAVVMRQHLNQRAGGIIDI